MLALPCLYHWPEDIPDGNQHATGVPLVCHWCATGVSLLHWWQFPGRTGKDISIKLWERYHCCKCEHGCPKAQVFKWAQTLIARVALLKLWPWWPEQSESLLLHMLSPCRHPSIHYHVTVSDAAWQIWWLHRIAECALSHRGGILVLHSSPLHHWIPQVKILSLRKLHLESDSQSDRG